jgi:hypothetical protein
MNALLEDGIEWRISLLDLIIRNVRESPHMNFEEQIVSEKPLDLKASQLLYSCTVELSQVHSTILNCTQSFGGKSPSSTITSSIQK